MDKTGETLQIKDTLGLALSYNWIMAVTSPAGHKTDFSNVELFTISPYRVDQPASRFSVFPPSG